MLSTISLYTYLQKQLSKLYLELVFLSDTHQGNKVIR